MSRKNKKVHHSTILYMFATVTVTRNGEPFAWKWKLRPHSPMRGVEPLSSSLVSSRATVAPYRKAKEIPIERFERTTTGLKVQRSTTELNGRVLLLLFFCW